MRDRRPGAREAASAAAARARTGEGDRRGLPRLHLVTDDEVLARPDWRAAAVALLSAGGGGIALHVRGPGLGGRRLYDLVEALLEAAAPTGGAVVVNDRVDVALTLPVAGVQLRESSLPVDVARRLLGGERWIGASVHDAVRAASAQAKGADYLVVGTVFATPTHPERAGGGAPLLAEVLASTELPLIAIGGVTPQRATEVRAAGAYGVAVLGGVWRTSDPVAAMREYLNAVEP